jgi:hypothetical protein
VTPYAEHFPAERWVHGADGVCTRMSRVQFPCLWFDGDAEEAAGFYVTLLPDS